MCRYIANVRPGGVRFHAAHARRAHGAMARCAVPAGVWLVGSSESQSGLETADCPPRLPRPGRRARHTRGGRPAGHR